MKLMEYLLLSKENLDNNDYINESYLDNIENLSKKEIANRLNEIIKTTLIDVGRNNAKDFSNSSTQFNEQLNATIPDKKGYTLAFLKYFNSITIVSPSKECSMSVTIEKTHFQKNTLCWALRHSGLCYSKVEKEFEYETIPSSRTEEFFNEFRFSSPMEAVEVFKEWLSNERNYQNKEYFIKNFNYDELKEILQYVD